MNRLSNAVTKEACNTRNIASPARVAMNALGVASMSRVNNGAKSPNRIASSPRTDAGGVVPCALA